jgi:hypothetical protein
LRIEGAGQEKELWFHENFFQSLENARKIFPIIGKIGPILPTIGKIFSNHWKTAVFPMSYQIGQNPGD